MKKSMHAGSGQYDSGLPACLPRAGWHVAANTRRRESPSSGLPMNPGAAALAGGPDDKAADEGGHPFLGGFRARRPGCIRLRAVARRGKLLAKPPGPRPQTVRQPGNHRQDGLENPAKEAEAVEGQHSGFLEGSAWLKPRTSGRSIHEQATRHACHGSLFLVTFRPVPRLSPS